MTVVHVICFLFVGFLSGGALGKWWARDEAIKEILHKISKLPEPIKNRVYRTLITSDDKE